MALIAKLQKQSDIVSKVYDIFKRAKMAGKALKMATNAKTMQSVISSRFPGMNRAIPKAPIDVSQGSMVLKKYASMVNTQYGMKIADSELMGIFKQVYVYMTKALIGLNTAGTIAGATAVSLSAGWALLIVPFSVVATISVFSNAKKHGISYQQATANFKKSFKEFLERDKFTKKEKAFAYLPYLVIAVAIFLLQSSWAGASIEKLLIAKTGKQDIGTGTIKSGIAAAQDMFASAGISYKKDGILTKVTVKEFIVVFSAAFVIYLLLSVLDQMILRKGESSSEV